MTPPRLAIIIGSIRDTRRGAGVAEWVFKASQERKTATYELVGLKEWPLPFYNEVAGPKTIQGVYKEPLAKKWSDTIKQFDGFIFVTPEYNWGYPASLKNVLDYLYDEWVRKPAAFVSYGGVSGGLRSQNQLRQVVNELQMVPVRSAVSLQLVSKVIGENGELLNPVYANALTALFDDLEWWSATLKKAREETSTKI